MSQLFEKRITTDTGGIDFLFVPLNLSFTNVYVVSCYFKNTMYYFHMKEDKKQGRFVFTDKYRCPAAVLPLEDELSAALVQHDRDQQAQ